MEASVPAGELPAPSYWIVICPEPAVRGGVSARWYQEGCVAVGWYPPNWSLNGGGENTPGWTFARNRLKEIRVGDKVIPFLLQYRIGPVGTVREIKVADADWNPTVEKGNYSGSEEPELGRRILVTWEKDAMPPDGMIATVPTAQRPGGGRAPVAFHTIERLTVEQFQSLCAVLGNKNNWSAVTRASGASPPDAEGAEIEVPPPPPPPAALSLLERDLQRFLARNLGVIESGLRPDPAYQLEEYTIDVGRIDLLCRDARGDWVVIELKADWAGDDSVGQILAT